MDQSRIRHDLFLRYRLIEIIAFWEGRLTTNHLQHAFGFTRQSASKTINDYIKIAPDNLIYEASNRGYRASEVFSPQFSQGNSDEYLDLIGSQTAPNSMFGTLALKPANCAVLHPPLRNLDPAVVRPIVQACQDNLRLEVNYVSLANPSKDQRVIVPHTLVHTGVRWHARAYCEKNKSFRDFVLSRFVGTPEVVTASEITSEQDTDWNTWIDVIIRPDSRMKKEQRQVVEREYGMAEGVLKVTIRGPLVQYYLDLIQIDTKVLKLNPSSQQIIVENFDELQRWLF